ncbi:MAG: hypothetical protein JOZ18_19940 [Chloroflexi bacterium]|nr:hypothetical protein [Chloroflexota bacterium]
MPERQGQGGEPWNKPSSQSNASLNGTSKLHTVPQRPPGMTRVSPPPPTPRVARPERKKPGNSRRWLLIIGGLFVVVFLACAGLAWAVGYGAINTAIGLNASSGASTTTADFLDALAKGDYDRAYKDLGPAVTLRTSPDEFKQQGQTADRCYGTVQNYSEVPNSASSQGNNQSYSYTITRSKLQKTYELHITLQQDPDGNGWKIADYGGDLGPGQQGPACK